MILLGPQSGRRNGACLFQKGKETAPKMKKAARDVKEQGK
jgi:hypothetical protein